jgi:hypothetical protein
VIRLLQGVPDDPATKQDRLSKLRHLSQWSSIPVVSGSSKPEGLLSSRSLQSAGILVPLQPFLAVRRIRANSYVFAMEQYPNVIFSYAVILDAYLIIFQKVTVLLPFIWNLSVDIPYTFDPSNPCRRKEGKL